MENETEPSPAARKQGSFNHEVFISFRGEDTRNGFTAHLHKELKTHGITAFIDSKELGKGEKISDVLEHIEGSKIFLPVFSTNYADSKWCLREITKIVEIYEREGKRRPIIPIFYHVDPSDVRHCRGSFGAAFKKHKQDKKLGEEEINEWKAALKAAGELSGYRLSIITEETEAMLVTLIRKDVSKILCKVRFDIQPVGIIPRMHTLKQMLEREKDGVCMIGICGLVGIGKTTLAMALYNELSPTFEGSCFLSDIRSKSEDRDGLPTLQAELINEDLRGRETKNIATVEEGISLIKQSLGTRKVLLILDDVGHKNQLAAFTADRRKKEEWFGKGSKIIVTTRDKTVLIQHGLQEYDIYFAEGLNIEDSLQLFCHHAFVSDQPLVGFEGLSLEVVKVAQGLPLALKEFGSLFGDLEEKKEWEHKLEILKRDQHLEIHKRLKIGYDSLDSIEQSVFLDIACFFIGWGKEYPVHMWKACGYFPTITLTVLQHKSLITINEDGTFEMHDQIRDMGRMIVKEEGNSDPLKYSRPWTKDQILDVLRDAKVFPNLKILNLSWCKCLIQTPDFTHLPSLEVLLLELCGSLIEMDNSIGQLQKLVKLNLWGCNKLKGLPAGLCKLSSLESLDLSDCQGISVLPAQIGNLRSLKYLNLEGTSISDLPDSIVGFQSLQTLNLAECKGISILPTQMGDLRSLRYFGLSGTSISALPDCIGTLQNLEKLDLSNCSSLKKMPDSIGGLKSLSSLFLKNCKFLEQLPDSVGMLTSLKELNIDHCKSLREVPDSLGYLSNDIQISLHGCISLEKLPKPLRIANASIRFDGCKSLRRLPDSTAARAESSFKYKVFISFRGEDTRKRFTSHLHKELAETRSISTFIDNEDLRRGEKISVLFKRIEGSKIFLPVFSINYADSQWCLREITKMVEINKMDGDKRPIIPVFYDVSPSDVRHPMSSFGKALEKHQPNEKLSEKQINEWRTALTEAASISGFCLSDTEGNEAKLITLIGKGVSNILCNVPFDIQPVGIITPIHTLNQMLERENDGVCMIGICGLGGIGKTTLAMALYNELSSKFEGSCFLSDIRSKSECRDGLPTLQAELMKSVLGQETKKIAKVEQGVSLIKQSLGVRKVLLVLDDVDDKEQLEAFTGNHQTKGKWFGEGSKIIVTTRDERVLLQHGLQECDIYFPEGLNTKDSLQLFGHHAFVNDQPRVGFEELSLEVVKAAQGLPLALKVFGALCYDLKEKKEWEEMLEILKRDQHKKVHERLKVSYDNLDQNQQSVFLDIACFFIGETKEHPIYMWEACGYFPRFTLKVLQHKSLIKINEYGRFEMHDQIRDMGRMIVKEEGNSNPLKYSRPWSNDQLLKVLRDAKVSPGNNPCIQGIDFNNGSNEKLELSWRVIQAMPNLRMITGIAGKFGCFLDKETTIRFPNNVRWLQWRKCPYQTLTFHRHEQLCVLDLSGGDFREFRLHRTVFPKLKVLNLSWCKCLSHTPDFTHLPSLEVLLLNVCVSLTEVDNSIGQLEKLVKLSLWGCSKLKELPTGLYKLSSLESLDLSECQEISVLPTEIGNLRSLKYFGLEGTSISNLPDSIGGFQSLQTLNLAECTGISTLPKGIGDLTSLKNLGLERTSISALPDSIGSLQSLEWLNINECKGISVLPTQLGELRSLKYFELSGTSILALPDCIGMLQKLERLDLSNCSSLRKLPDSMGDLRSLSWLFLKNCKFLEQLPSSMGMLTSLKGLNIDHCKSLREVPDLNNDIRISSEGCISLKKLPNSIGRVNISL